MRPGKLRRCERCEDAHEGAESMALLDSVDQGSSGVYLEREPDNNGADPRRKAPVGFEVGCAVRGARPRHTASSSSRTASTDDVHAVISAHDRHDAAGGRVGLPLSVEMASKQVPYAGLHWMLSIAC